MSGAAAVRTAYRLNVNKTKFYRLAKGRYNTRTWRKWGRLPYIDYTAEAEPVKPAEPTAPAGTGDNPSAWAKAATEYCKRKGIFAGDGAGNFDWQKPITREQVAAVLYRTLERAGLLETLPDKE